MAAPVTDHGGRVAATICFMVPRDLTGAPRERLLTLLVESGRSLSVFAEPAGELAQPARPAQADKA